MRGDERYSQALFKEARLCFTPGGAALSCFLHYPPILSVKNGEVLRPVDLACQLVLPHQLAMH
jgi:hypothetical protein